MRKLWPFVGLALAVAVGIALAPYVWWLVALAGLAGTVMLAWRFRAGVWTVFGAIVVGAVIYWPIWLWRRGQVADAWFVTGLVVLWLGWNIVRGYLAASQRARQADHWPADPPVEG